VFGLANDNNRQVSARKSVDFPFISWAQLNNPTQSEQIAASCDIYNPPPIATRNSNKFSNSQINVAMLNQLLRDVAD